MNIGDFFVKYPRNEADRQYNSTLWAQRLSPEELIPHHIEFSNSKSQIYRDKMGENLTQIDFGTGEFTGEIDAFCPAHAREDAPIVIYIHGGWWQWFSKEQFSFLAEPFNNRGMTVYLPGYTLAQDWNNDPIGSIIKQMENAVAKILQTTNSSSPVFLVGHSVGGQLVSVLHKTDWNGLGVSATDAKRIKAVFSLAGLYDLRPLVDSFVNDVIGMSEQAAIAASPQFMQPPTAETLCPLHLVVPEYDGSDFFRQAKEYQDQLLKQGHPCNLQLASKSDHLDMLHKLLENDDALFNYLVQSIESAL